jgi:TRAP-type uncharacterized transport system fused permease subunit
MAMIGMSYLFGWLVGAGLPPTATYIIGAVVIVQPLVSLGINPWVAHFFVFLLSVWGELSPPTSLTAAISARIAEASFMRTMWEALKICLPITLMTFAIFTRSDMVINPGWKQVIDTLLVLVSTCGTAYAMFGRFSAKAVIDIGYRLLMAAISFVTMFHPNDLLAKWTAPVVLALLVFGVSRHAEIASPKTGTVIEDENAAAASDAELNRLAAEAKREM